MNLNKLAINNINFSKLPNDSLLRLAPVRHALEDPYFKCLSRPIDNQWTYAEIIKPMAGYSPIESIHYYAKNSVFEEWLQDPVNLGRKLNADDCLVREVLVMAHDYLHSWAYRALHKLDPKLGIGQAKVTRENMDFFAFVHLLTEAVACVGLDYWYLCIKSINLRCDLGSRQGPLTTKYIEADLPEFKKFNPNFKVQNQNFLSTLIKFYCSNEFHGFGIEDLAASPKLSKWVNLEVAAAHGQKNNIRLWLSSIGGFKLSERELGEPIKKPNAHQIYLTNEIAKLLWQKIKLGKKLYFKPSEHKNRWQSKPKDCPDFRIMNINKVPTSDSYNWKTFSEAQLVFSYFMQQHISRFSFPKRDLQLQQEIKESMIQIEKNLDLNGLFKLTSKLKKFKPDLVDPAPAEMMFLS